MKFEEILPALRERKRVRRRSWRDGNYIVIRAFDQFVCNRNDADYTPGLDDLNGDDWEIVKETKKVKLRDLTEEQYINWRKNNCCANICASSCPFKYINCCIGWINYKEIYSDNFLDQEIEVEE